MDHVWCKFKALMSEYMHRIGTDETVSWSQLIKILKWPIENFAVINIVISGREPWSSGDGRRLVFQRSWVWIPVLYTALTLLSVLRIVMFVWKDENKRIRGRKGPFLKKTHCHQLWLKSFCSIGPWTRRWGESKASESCSWRRRRGLRGRSSLEASRRQPQTLV